MRLDWATSKANILHKIDLGAHSLSHRLTALDNVAMNICGLISWDHGGAFMEELCLKQLVIGVTGLNGIPKDHSRKKFNKHEIEADSLMESRFTTFEI